MFVADDLLIEKARIALMTAQGDGTCVISGALDGPYRPLMLAVFRGDDGKRLASQARDARRLSQGGVAYRVIADLSAPLDREDVLLIEAA